jgi:hypothetical protein
MGQLGGSLHRASRATAQDWLRMSTVSPEPAKEYEIDGVARHAARLLPRACRMAHVALGA